MSARTDTAPVGCLRLIARGRVQGVNYRAACVNAARAIGVTGWVRNRLDGSVEALACAPPDQLERFAVWMRQGPTLACVDDLAITKAELPQPVPSTFERRPTA